MALNRPNYVAIALLLLLLPLLLPPMCLMVVCMWLLLLNWPMCMVLEVAAAAAPSVAKHVAGEVVSVSHPKLA